MESIAKPQETWVVILNVLGNLFFELYKAETGIHRVEKERMIEEVNGLFSQLKPLVKDREAFAKATELHIQSASNEVERIGRRDADEPIFISHAIYALNLFKDFHGYHRTCINMIKNAPPRNIKL